VVDRERWGGQQGVVRGNGSNLHPCTEAQPVLAEKKERGEYGKVPVTVVEGVCG